MRRHHLRQFATLGTFARPIDGNVMIMAEGANTRIGSRIVRAGALAGSIEDAGDVAPPVAGDEIPDNGGGLRIQNPRCSPLRAMTTVSFV